MAVYIDCIDYTYVCKQSLKKSQRSILIHGYSLSNLVLYPTVPAIKRSQSVALSTERKIEPNAGLKTPILPPGPQLSK